MKAIQGDTRAETWLKALRHLRDADELEDYNVVLEVSRPGISTLDDHAVDARLDALLVAAGVLPINSVADTIFPAKEYRLHGTRGVYETYPDVVYPGIKPTLGWGTYAHRLLRNRGRKGEPINPLKDCVEKIKRQLAKVKGVMTNCYELSLSTEAEDEDIPAELPTYRPASDRAHTFGRPCLSHISLKITRDRRLNLTALYRSHYYIERALGNLLGLARLQAFVGRQTGLKMGTLVCVSTYARLDLHTGWGLQRIDEFLQESVVQSSPSQRRKLEPTHE